MIMAQAKQTPQEFIQNVFSPSIAAICSSDAEELCQKNNLSFVELVQPFCRFNSEATFKDPMNQSCNVRNLRIVLKDVNAQPPQPSVAKKMLNDVVLNCQVTGESSPSVVVKSTDAEIVLPAVLPWFEAYRDCFFEISYPSDHEFTKHFLACIFVVSSSNANPIAELTRLNQLQHQMQHQNPSKSPKWFLPNIFKGFIILHDISEGDSSKAEAIFQNAKSTFSGSFCHLLQINSRSVNVAHEMTATGSDNAQPPDPWSQFLSKKIDTNETSEYDNSPRTPQEDIFPNKLCEGGSDLDITQITEVGTEVTENASEKNNSFQHPLSPENDTVTVNCISQDKPEKCLKIETVDKEDTPLAGIVNDTKHAWSKEVPTVSRPHGLCLTVSDMDRLRIFIHEFVLRGLLPYVEKQMKFLHEAVATRKGLHRSFLSATKKWFVGNKPGFQSPSAPNNTVIYSQEATELQVRKLGDLAFMFQHYDLAYQAYHSAKRDFNNDQAWLYFAGALEMAALSIFMLGASSQRQYPFHYFENSINTYLNVCKSPQFATRATLLSSECLKSKGMFGEAAMQFIKMTSEDSDLRSALLLEQAAHCFTAMPAPMARKYAFHMILAGHRFSKSGQRKHALRAYKQAYQVYISKNWNLAEDHVNFTIGRQSLNLKLLPQALDAFQNLLNKNSQQSASQQTAFLKEFLFVYNLMREQNAADSCGILPLPVIENQCTKIIHGPIVTFDKGQFPQISSLSFENDEEDDLDWFKLEEIAYEFVNGPPAATFRPCLQRLTRLTNNFYKPLGVMKEPVTVEIAMNNPFHIPLFLSNIHLLWRFTLDGVSEKTTNDNDDLEKNNNYDNIVITENIAELVLDCCQTEKIHLSLWPQRVGELTILGISYELGTYSPTQQIVGSTEPQTLQNSNRVTAQGKQYIKVLGPRLNNTKAEKVAKAYGPDYRLESIIVPSIPYLQVKFISCPSRMLCGEVQQVILELTNTGNSNINNICVASLTPELFTFGQHAEFSSLCLTSSSASSNHCNVYNDFAGKSSEIMMEMSNVDRTCFIPLPKHWNSLEAKTSYKLPMWIRGADEPGTHKIKLLFYYESPEVKSKMKYRVLRYKATVEVYPSLTVRASAVRNYSHLTKENANSLAIAVEVENINEFPDNKIKNINVVQLSSASKNWVVQPIGTLHESDVEVSLKEIAHLCFRAVKFPSQSSNQLNCILFSNVSFSNREIDSSATPCSDFCYRSQMNLLPLETEDANLTLPQMDAMSSSLLASSFTAGNTEADSINVSVVDEAKNSLQIGLTLIVIWKAFVTNSNGINHCIMGQHHLNVDKINVSMKLPTDVKPTDLSIQGIIPDYEQSIQATPSVTPNVDLSQLVQTVLMHPFNVDHDFREASTCIVVVDVIIYNCSEASLQVTVNAAKANLSSDAPKVPSGQSGHVATFPMTSSLFSWIGSTHNRMAVQPGELTQISMQACFFSAGTYNLGNICVDARFLSNVDDVAIPQQSCQPSLIIVNNVCHPS